MSSKIEQLIDEIEDYINSCKYQTLSKTNIIVNKDEIDELLKSLPTKAQALIDEATEHTTHLINEHEIMQQAYAQANEVVTLATRQAQEILDSATNDANGVRDAAMRYLDEMLANMENLMTSTLNTTTAHYESFYKAINSFNDVVKANRAEMHPELADLSNPETYDIQDEGEDA